MVIPVTEPHIQASVAADLSGLEIAGQDIKLGEQGHGTGFANAFGLTQPNPG
jgi:hypothetical protein